MQPIRSFIGYNVEFYVRAERKRGITLLSEHVSNVCIYFILIYVFFRSGNLIFSIGGLLSR